MIAFLLASLLLTPQLDDASHATVRIETPELHGSRTLEKQTESAVVKDYLQSWSSLRTAMDHNDSSVLDAYFVGTARDRLVDTIQDQAKYGIHTRYTERSHDLQIVFYSPEGLSIQLMDTVSYDEEVLQKDKVLATKPVTRRYLVVLTPSEVRWRVRILQSEAQ
jgi:hypothetical protein